jgi:uncharacterized protein YndB with AHSA1/START domain
MTHEQRYERVIAASPEAVFDAFTSEPGQRAFYGRDEPGWSVETACDLRVGGVWAVTFGTPGATYGHRHVFSAVERPHRLAFVTTETGPDGPPFDFDVEITFAARDGGCAMTMRQSGFTTAAERDRHGAGVPNAVDRLERLIHHD